MYVKLAVMRWVKLFIVGQPADQKNVNGKGDHATLYFTMGHPFPPQICPSPWGDLDPNLTWFPGPTGVLSPNGIWIGTAIFAGLTSVTDRPTDHATRSVTIDRIHVHSTGDEI